MEDIFITRVKIKSIRHLKDFEIPLSKDSRKHLILTGKNGSGKTSVLEVIESLLKFVSVVGGEGSKGSLAGIAG